jgi:hypothetical protein
MVAWRLHQLVTLFPIHEARHHRPAMQGHWFKAIFNHLL